jgi:hypothetical protein
MFWWQQMSVPCNLAMNLFEARLNQGIHEPDENAPARCGGRRALSNLTFVVGYPGNPISDGNHRVFPSQNEKIGNVVSITSDCCTAI